MKPAYEYGSEVRLIRNVRNDGTYPGMEIGELLVRRGSVGFVYDVGTYLQDQLVYRVHFLDAGRTIGCRQEELNPADEPWAPSLYEFKDKVKPRFDLKVRGEVIVAEGVIGQVVKVLRDTPNGVMYHVAFDNGKSLQLPEAAIEAEKVSKDED